MRNFIRVFVWLEEDTFFRDLAHGPQAAVEFGITGMRFNITNSFQESINFTPRVGKVFAPYWPANLIRLNTETFHASWESEFSIRIHLFSTCVAPGEQGMMHGPVANANGVRRTATKKDEINTFAPTGVYSGIQEKTWGRRFFSGRPSGKVDMVFWLGINGCLVVMAGTCSGSAGI